jgi:hypothetical protein
MNEREDAQLAELAAYIRERDAVDARLGRLLDRPMNRGSIGERIAAITMTPWRRPSFAALERPGSQPRQP